MGIRDFTYYDRKLLLRTNATDHNSSGYYSKISKCFSDLSGNFYTLENFVLTNFSGGFAVRKSSNSGSTWSTVKRVINSGSSNTAILGGDVDSSGTIFIGYSFQTGSSQNFVVEKSTDAGSSWSVSFLTAALVFNGEDAMMLDIGTHSQNKDHVCTFLNGRLIFTTNHGNSWQSQSLSNAVANNLKFSKVSASVYAATTFTTDLLTYNSEIYSASFNVGSSIYNNFGLLFSETFNSFFGRQLCRSLAFQSDGMCYAVQHSSSGGVSSDKIVVLTASNGRNFGKHRVISISGSEIYESLSALADNVGICFDNKDRVFHSYVSGAANYTEFSLNSNFSWSPWTARESIRLFNANVSGGLFQLPQLFMVKSSEYNSELYLMTINSVSSSLSPISLASTISYPSTFPGNPEIRYKLNNISEYPHAGGLFQMKNVILGTVTTGKVGTSEDSIVQIRHIGSVVKVMWPKQDSINTPIKGFGDFSAGERPGKLTNQFQPGDEIDVTEFDHVCLYGYLSKIVSGSLDDVVITVERKPLNNAAYTIDQSIDRSVSGSITEARLRNLEYRKEIDYGDLSIKNIGFPVDVPLINTKMLRVSVKHRNGQTAEENKNFILWGRFVKSSKNTNET